MMTKFKPTLEYLDRRLEDRDRIWEARWRDREIAENRRIEAAIIGLNDRNTALDKRLDSMNEIREQLNRQASAFVTREYVEVSFQRIDERVRTLQGQRANLEGRVWAIGIGFSIVNLVIAALGLWRAMG